MGGPHSVGWKHPECEERSLRDDGSCRWPYCFDWSFSESERAIIERAKDKARAMRSSEYTKTED